jgi:isocitrate lyase
MSLKERAAFDSEVAEVEKWWKVRFIPVCVPITSDFLYPYQDSRFARVKRPYTAAQVVSKRGTIPISYPSNILAKKLWKQLSDHFRDGTPSHTYGA